MKKKIAVIIRDRQAEALRMGARAYYTERSDRYLYFEENRRP
jgi:hypothetical protein